MGPKLEKTLLSQKISFESKIIGILSVFILFGIHLLDHRFFMANGDLVFKQGEYWRAFLSSLIHADYKHLGTNSAYFFILSVLLHNYFGNLIFPLLSIFIGFIINLITLSFYPPETFLLGISGVVYFMGAFWLVMYVLIERGRPIHHRLIITTGMFLIFFAPHAVIEENVSYLAHGVGFGLGLILAFVIFLLRKNEIRSEEVWRERKSIPPLWEEQVYEKDASEESVSNDLL
jgi:rhomboid protease GluP